MSDPKATHTAPRPWVRRSLIVLAVGAAATALAVSLPAAAYPSGVLPGADATGVGERRESLLIRLDDAEHDLDRIDAALAAARARRGALQVILAEAPEREVVEEVTGPVDPATDLIRQRIAELRLEEIELLEHFEPQSRTVLAVHKQIKMAESLLAAEKKAHRRVTLATGELHRRTAAALAIERSEIAGLEAERAEVERQVERIREALDAGGAGAALVHAGPDRTIIVGAGLGASIVAALLVALGAGARRTYDARSEVGRPATATRPTGRSTGDAHEPTGRSWSVCGFRGDRDVASASR